MQGRAPWLDFIKVFAVLFTLFLHANAPLANWQTAVSHNPVTFNQYYWDISMFFAALAGMTFALIFMYFGAVTLNSKEVSFTFFIYKAKSLILPLIAWTIIYTLFYKYMMHRDIEVLPQLLTSLFSPVAKNLWILYTLIAMFLILPLLKIVMDHTNTKQQIYLSILWIFAVSIPPFSEHFFNIKISTDLPMMTGYIGYMIIGYILSKIKLTKTILQIAIIFVIMGITWSTFYSIFNSKPDSILIGQYAGFFYSRFSFPMIMHSIGSFILLRFIAEQIIHKDVVKKVLHSLSPKALGICLIYPFWFTILGTEKIGIEITAFIGNPFWSVPLTASLTILGSLMTVSILKKIPYVQTIVPKLF